MLTRPDYAQTIILLQEWQVQRRGLIRAKNRVYLASVAMVRRGLGFHTGDEEETRAAVSARAKRLVDRFIAGKLPEEEDAGITAALAGQLSIWRAMLDPAVTQIAELEKAMTTSVIGLPGYDFVKSVRGFGDKAFAIVIGEAGDLANYPAKGHLWKRLGLAPFDKDGEVRACSTWARKGGLSADDWIEAGYKRERLAEVIVSVALPLIKLNDWPYRAAYLRRKELEREKAAAEGLKVCPSAKIPKGRADEFRSDGHIDNRAKRYVAQIAVRDLWRAWNAPTSARWPISGCGRRG